jgi:hypothetical protein
MLLERLVGRSLVRRTAVFCRIILVAMAFGAGVSSAFGQAGADPTFYRLTDKSTWQQGCYAPCVCPVSEQSPMSGTFWVAPLASTQDLEAYAITDVVWQVTDGDQRLCLTGGGTYYISRGAQTTHQLQLDLETDGGAVEHYDSGMVPGRGALPAIDITVSINGGACFDTVIQVAAEPATRAAGYRLGKAGTWQQGSADGGGCALGEPLGVRGTFLLAYEASNPPYDTYAITDVDWLVQTPDGPRWVTGSGTYQIGGEFGLSQRLQLDLRTNAGPVEHLDSGEVARGAAFPAIDITIGINPQACFDTVIHVLAKPAGDFNLDGSVDESDFDWFQACLTGPDQPHPDPACSAADLDDDGDIDQVDFGGFQRCITPPGGWIDPACVQ